MTDLIETVAKTIGQEVYGFTDPATPNTWANSLSAARAAFAAIEAAGYRVVPIEPTEAMEMDGKCELIALAADLATSKWAARKAYMAMVQCAPKVTE